MIKETCACGATFEMNDTRLRDGTGYRDTRESAAATEWRKDHKHETPTPPETQNGPWVYSPPWPGFPQSEFPNSGCSYCGSFKHIARECPHA